MSYSDHHSHRDGRILLYRRNGRPVFHARMKVDGIAGHVVKSTRMTRLEDAIRASEELHDELRYKAKNGLETSQRTFASLWRRWLESHEGHYDMGPHRLRYIKGTVERYLIPFFGNRPLSEIVDVEMAKYWEWRKRYWESPEGLEKIALARRSRATAAKPYKQKLGNVARQPAPKTLKMEQSVLKQIFSWAFQTGQVSRMPYIKAPIRLRHASETRRPAFDLGEWRTLYQFLRDWAAGTVPADETGGEGKPGRPNSMHLRHRELLRNYVLIMGRTGLRPNEARQLRWRDIDEHVDADGTKYLVLLISPKTKTGERDVVALGDLTEVFDRIRAASTHTGPDDYVFCDEAGKPIENFGKTFKSVLTQCGLLKDRHGSVRTIYSLRHTYATQRLLHGEVSIEDLARNMGTSVSMIEKHYSHVTNRQKARQLSGRLLSGMSRKGLNW